MFPLPLSEDLFSLRPNEDRLAKTVELRFSPEGEPLGYRIFRSVFRSAFRTNEGGAEAARDRREPLGHNEALVDALEAMSTIVTVELDRTLRTTQLERTRRGGDARFQVMDLLVHQVEAGDGIACAPPKTGSPETG